jgi:hypothetical protein
MAVSPQHRIDFPKMKVVLEPAFMGSLEGARNSGDWPIITTSEGDIDLRRVTHAEARKLYFFYGTQMQAEKIFGGFRKMWRGPKATRRF